MEQAIDAQIEAESFGKTAKYLRSGTFQGMAMGTGLGVAPGATLGALTGTLVGGVTSTITGGIGGGIGAVAGALHGPFVNLGEVAGKGIKKVTGNLPSWEASDEQKKTLEKMIGQVGEEDMPEKDELERLRKEGVGAGSGEDLKGWAESARDMMPDMSSKRGGGEEGKNTDGERHRKADGDENKKADGEQRKKPRKLETRSESSTTDPADTTNRKKPRKLETKSNSSKGNQADKKADADAEDGKEPRTTESTPNTGNKPSTRSAGAKGQPRKLEKRLS
ncbi:hypothetical protein K458DRAFT_180397 [Lentithecium fluviatile CBS 122367]|uniref:Glycine zipper domain-containing protein n=1 Tax=Lentithecium fluviatile CBS 122367 TaxID=1168545 RepID=A0A6G1IEN8_9PLEO|nr:hypothetical protein K458DRAFT_180397 [Lentithecium fluviatile CBS 122367]